MFNKNQIRKSFRRISIGITAFVAAISIQVVGTPQTVYATQSRSGNFVKNYSLSGTPATDIVAVARAQAGRTQGAFGYTEAWCADFVSDCAALAGASSAIPASGGSTTLFKYVTNAGGKVVKNAQAGDLVFYKSGNGYYHVGIMISPNASVQGNLYRKGDKSQTKKVFDNTKPDAVGASYVFVHPNYGASKVAVDTETPVIKNAVITNITENGFDVSCIVTDNMGVERVCFPTWTSNKWQDDIVWHEASYNKGRWNCHIDVSQHKGETGTYITHIYAYDKAGNEAMQELEEFKVGVFPNDIKLNQSHMELYVGDTATLTATVYPANAIDKTVKWSSDNNSVVTVDSGRIKAVKAGTANIKAQLSYIPMNGNWHSTCNIVVKEQEIPVEEKIEQINVPENNTEDNKNVNGQESIQQAEKESGQENDNKPEANIPKPEWKYADRADVTMNQHTLQMNIGETTTLSATVIPADAVKDNQFKWTSSDTSVVLVEDGVIKAVGKGTAVIKASIGYVPPEGRWQDQCIITVTDTSSQENYYEDDDSNDDNKAEIVSRDKVYPTEVFLNTDSLSMVVDEKFKLDVTINPDNATERTLNWSSSNENVVRVSNGTVIAVGPGNAEITVSLPHVFADSMVRKSWFAVCEVTVTEQGGF